MKEFLLDVPVPVGFFSYLRSFGQVEALPNIGEGFYKFEKIDWFTLKGFAGDISVEVRFKREVMDLTMDFVYVLFSSYQTETMDLTTLKQREQAIEKRVKKRLYGV
jgi:hypothetical protein